MSKLPDNAAPPEPIAQEELLHRALFRKRLITEPPHDPSHAEIVGWPDDETDAEAEEERLAGLLARQAKVLWLE